MGLLSEEHRQRMGEAIWLFEWVVGRQTAQTKSGIGIVNYGKSITYGVIHADTNYPIATIRKWMARLIKERYVVQEFQPNNEFVLRLMKAKKYPIHKQISTDLSQALSPSLNRGSRHVWTEAVSKLGDRGVLKLGRGGARKRQQAFGFDPTENIGIRIASPKVLLETTTTILRASPESPVYVNQQDSKHTSKPEETIPIAGAFAGVMQSTRMPRQAKSARELRAEKERQLLALQKWAKENGVKL